MHVHHLKVTEPTFTSQLIFRCFFFSVYQMTPLHVAAERGGRLNIVKYLVVKNADITNIQDNDGVKLCN